jgi:hypothetical protein
VQCRASLQEFESGGRLYVGGQAAGDGVLDGTIAFTGLVVDCQARRRFPFQAAPFGHVRHKPGFINDWLRRDGGFVPQEAVELWEDRVERCRRV